MGNRKEKKRKRMEKEKNCVERKHVRYTLWKSDNKHRIEYDAMKKMHEF